MDDLVELPQHLWALLVEAVRWMVISPVQQGRLRLNARSVGVRAFAMVSVAVALVGAVVILFSRPLRAGSRLAVVATSAGVLSFPRGLLWIPVMIMVVSIALILAAALHAPVRLRVPMVVVNSLLLLFVGTSDVATGISPGTWTAFGAVVVVVTIHAVRWRREPVWWEPIIMLLVVTVLFVVVLRGAVTNAEAFTIDRMPAQVEGLLRVIQLLTVPMLVVAGVAIAKVSLTGVTMVSDVAAKRLSTRTLGLIALSVLLLRGFTSAYQLVADIAQDTARALRSLLGASVLLGTAALARQRAIRLAASPSHARVATGEGGSSDARDAEEAADEEGVPVGRGALPSSAASRVTVFDGVALPAALCLTFFALPLLVANLVQLVAFAIWSDGPVVGWADWWVRYLGERSTGTMLWVVGAAALLVYAHRCARHGRRIAAELTAVIGVVALVGEVGAAQRLLPNLRPSPIMLDRVCVLTVVAYAGWLLVRGRVSGRQHMALLLALLLSVLLNERDFISNPLTVMIGAAGIAAPLFGLVWGLFSDASVANGDSRRYPRDTRLMFFLAQVLFGVAVLVWLALAREPASSFLVGVAADVGDRTLGVALLLAVFFVSLREAKVSDGDSAERAPATHDHMSV